MQFNLYQVLALTAIALISPLTTVPGPSGSNEFSLKPSSFAIRSGDVSRQRRQDQKNLRDVVEEDSEYESMARELAELRSQFNEIWKKDLSPDSAASQGNSDASEEEKTIQANIEKFLNELEEADKKEEEEKKEAVTRLGKVRNLNDDLLELPEAHQATDRPSRKVEKNLGWPPIPKARKSLGRFTMLISDENFKQLSSEEKQKALMELFLKEEKEQGVNGEAHFPFGGRKASTSVSPKKQGPQSPIRAFNGGSTSTRGQHKVVIPTTNSPVTSPKNFVAPPQSWVTRSPTKIIRPLPVIAASTSEPIPSEKPTLDESQRGRSTFKESRIKDAKMEGVKSGRLQQTKQ